MDIHVGGVMIMPTHHGSLEIFMSEPAKRRVAHPVLLAVFLSFIFSLALLVILLPIYGTP
jgi:hypothetical protein